MDRAMMIADVDEALAALQTQCNPMRAIDCLARLRAGLAGEAEAVQRADDALNLVRSARRLIESVHRGGCQTQGGRAMLEQADEQLARVAALIEVVRGLPSLLPPGPGAAPPAAVKMTPEQLADAIRSGNIPDMPVWLVVPADLVVPGEAATAGKTPEERAAAIYLATSWNGRDGETRSWDDVRRDIATAIRAAVADALAEPTALLRAVKKFAPHAMHCGPDCLRCKIEAWLKKGPQ